MSDDDPAIIQEYTVIAVVRKVEVLLPLCAVHLVVLPRCPLVGDGVGCLPVVIAILVVTGHGAAWVLADVRDASVL